MKQRARRILRETASLAAASTGGLLSPGEHSAMLDAIRRLKAEANALQDKGLEIQMDPARAVHHPATQYTTEFAGAEREEPYHRFPRMLYKTLLNLDVPQGVAAQLVQEPDADAAAGKKGKGQKRGGTKGKGEGKEGNGKQRRFRET